MAAHHCCDRREVGRPAAGRLENGRHLAVEQAGEALQSLASSHAQGKVAIVIA